MISRATKEEMTLISTRRAKEMIKEVVDIGRSKDNLKREVEEIISKTTDHNNIMTMEMILNNMMIETITENPKISQI